MHTVHEEWNQMHHQFGHHAKRVSNGKITNAQKNAPT